MRHKISCVLITKNEAKNIARCLESVKWMDEIVVVDSESTDRTLEICKEFDCKIDRHEWMGFGKTKAYAVSLAENDWIFSIDGDEAMTPELRKTIENLLQSDERKAGYYIKRRTYYLDRLIRFSGWNRDYPLRFFNRTFGTFNEKEVHESVRINEQKEHIEEFLLHYSYPNISSHLQKIDRYSTLGAQQLYDKGKSVSFFSAILRGKMRFIKMYFLQCGILDGPEGFILALISAFGVTMKYLKLWKMTS
ncbi:MAG: glycosyltransferase family 2 protein [Deferribacteres bacterium]|nr:glycosyltransferase family 2 protein [candidate division KSB1 bacterium]MCB9504369.1 glycosyltransferase family 2 protein [Deferribacteres bacterium]